jgi:hypothetical protein
MSDDDTIIIRRKFSEPAAPKITSKIKVWHVMVAIALISFIAGAVIC